MQLYRLVVVLITFLVLDAIYLGLQMASLQQLYKKIQNQPLTLKPLGAVLCYMFMVFVLYYFILSPKKSIMDAFILGLCIYGIYNTTSYAVLAEFPFRLVITDTLWGGILFAAATFIYYKTI